MSKVLFLYDYYPDLKKSLKQIKPDDELYVCPLISDPEALRALENELSRLNFNYRVVSFVEPFNKKAFSIRDGYIEFVAKFANKTVSGKKNLKQYFKYPGKEFSLWWFSLIAEKNTFKTDTYHKLVKLLTILDLQKKYNCETIAANISDADLAKCLKEAAKKINCKYEQDAFRAGKKQIPSVVSGLIYLYVFLKRKMTFSMRFKHQRSNCPFLFVTYFPAYEEESLQAGRYINKFFRPLQFALEKKYGKDKLAWLGLTVAAKDYDWKRTHTGLKDARMLGYNINLLEHWMLFRDIFFLLCVYLFISFKYLIIKRKIEKTFNFDWENIDVGIWHIFKKDWDTSFSGNFLIEGMIYYTVFHRALENYIDKTVIYMAEMQAWEKALNIAAKELKMTSIGIQHSNISLLFLNYFNDKSELDYANGLISMPKPDFLGCVGKIPEKIFLDNGWDKKHLFRFGATRFQHYLEHFKDARAWSDKKDRIVVAFCICPKETKELLSIVCQAFAASPQYEVVLKGHYANPFDFYSVQLPKNFRVSNEPLGKLLPEAKIIIVTESSSVFEGLACQSVPVIPLLLESVDLSPLSGISDLPYYANNPRELKSIVDKIISSSESPLVRQKVVEFLNDYCDFLDKDEDYLNRIETVLGRIKMC